MDRRAFVAAAVAIGASPLLAAGAARSKLRWREVAPRFPQGVASGDPTPDGFLLWTRRQPDAGETSTRLAVEVSEDADFERVVASRRVALSAQADWTCRVLISGLLPDRPYWYRFSDDSGAGSRVGRSRTAPTPSDDRAVRFAFVSCQNVTMGPLTAWRRMLFDDAKAPAGDGIDFVLHLGDFVYETVWYSEDRPKGYFDRKLNDLVRFPSGERHDDYHVPVDLEDYRTLYRNYLKDPDLQAARARWPFVAIWDNGEFSDKGWQSQQRFGSHTRPAQTRKAAANQAWFEFVPARVRTARGASADFSPPQVTDAPIERFDRDGLGLEPNNLAALGSLTGYRAVRWGQHVELLLTDQRSYRSDDFGSSAGAATISSKTFPQMVPYETLQMIDAGKYWAGGSPPTTLVFGDGEVPNFRIDGSPRTLLGRRQRDWLLQRLAASSATWKVWGNTVATFDMRADPQHLPDGISPLWPGRGYAGFPRTDHSTAFEERAEIYDHVRTAQVAGFVTLSGDRHSFWAGYSSKSLPPEGFDPVGANFVTGSLSSPGMVEAFEHSLARNHPLRPLYLADGPGTSPPEPTVNLLLREGVRSALDYAAHRDLAKAKALADPGNAPHVEFVDMAGHGYAVCTARPDGFAVEFVCIQRPVTDDGSPDGGAPRYRVRFETPLWLPGGRPLVTVAAVEGNAGLSV